MSMQSAPSSFPVDRVDPETRSVLIVDDESDIREGLAELLEFEGYNVITATDGEQALCQLQDGLRPAVILLDLMMPGMNGWDFRAQQLKDVDLRNIPVVVITAASVTEAALKAQLGDIYLVRKPLMQDQLISIVRRHCGEAAH